MVQFPARGGETDHPSSPATILISGCMRAKVSGGAERGYDVPAAQHGPRPRIVAGVDGSQSSREARRWAARQAGLTGRTVNAVIAWYCPVTADGLGLAPVTVDDVGLEEPTAQTLAGVVAGLPDPPGPM